MVGEHDGGGTRWWVNKVNTMVDDIARQAATILFKSATIERDGACVAQWLAGVVDQPWGSDHPVDC